MLQNRQRGFRPFFFSLFSKKCIVLIPGQASSAPGINLHGRYVGTSCNKTDPSAAESLHDDAVSGTENKLKPDSGTRVPVKIWEDMVGQ